MFLVFLNIINFHFNPSKKYFEFYVFSLKKKYHVFNFIPRSLILKVRIILFVYLMADYNDVAIN